MGNIQHLMEEGIQHRIMVAANAMKTILDNNGYSSISDLNLKSIREYLLQVSVEIENEERKRKV